MKRLIFVEGIPGSGKSTCARFLANQFERNGHTCELYLETTYLHPVIYAEGFNDYRSFIDSYLEKWSKFMSCEGDSEIIVMESALIQNPMIHLLHKDVDRSLIYDLIVKVSNLFNETDCKLVYLYQEDAAAAIERMIQLRGREDFLIRKHNEFKHEPYFVNREQLGVEAHISFFLEYAGLANQIVPDLRIETLCIENSKRDYSSYEEQLLQTFNLKLVPDPILDEAILKSYSGTYHNQELGLILHVEFIDGHLFIFENKQLKPKSTNQFYLDDMSVTVSFYVDAHETYRIVITEKDLYGNRSDEGTAFKRVS